MRMDVSKSVQDAMGSLLPWDLVIVIQGQDYRVRPLLVADLAALAQLDKSMGLESLQAFAALFDDPKPDLGKMSFEELSLTAMAIVSYFRDRAEKNSRAIAAQLQAAMGKTRS